MLQRSCPHPRDRYVGSASLDELTFRWGPIGVPTGRILGPAPYPRLLKRVALNHEHGS